MKKNSLLLLSLIVLFFIFSGFGWVWELIYYYIKQGRLINRGVLHGPWLPIYGLGGMMVLIFLYSFRKNPFVHFWMTVLVCGAFEYFGGWALEEIYHEKWWEPAAGAALGLGISLTVLLLGNLLFGAGSLGGADIKFFACIGLVTGRTGVAMIFILTTLLFAAYSAVLIAGRRGSIKDRNAMLPAACAATTVYFLFLWNIGDLLVIGL